MGDFRYMGKSLSGVQRGLGSLTDANISNPQDGDTLVYNGTTGKWEPDSTLNSNIIQSNGVSVTGNGVKTYMQLLNELYPLVDMSKVKPRTRFIYHISATYDIYYQLMEIDTTSFLSFVSMNSTNNSISGGQFIVKATGSQAYSATGTTRQDVSSAVMASGRSFEIVY